MIRLMTALLLLPCLLAPAWSAEIADATGRTVSVPDSVARVLPAGPPAAVLLAALAPDLMLGWPNKPPPAAAALLDPRAAALPAVPHLATSAAGLAAIQALHPDLILDYGTVNAGYIATIRTVQDKTGIASVLLDGSLEATPRVLRQLGTALHREARAEELARLAESLLTVRAPASPAPSVVYLRGRGDVKAAASGTGATEVFARLGWRVLAPSGEGWFRPIDAAGVAGLDPDILIFGDAAMRAAAAASPEWRGLRAVRDHRAFAAPRLPFGWIEEPPSLNRLLGLAWLAGGDVAALAATAEATLFGQAAPESAVQAAAMAATPISP